MKTSSGTVLEVRDLTKVYGEQRAVDGLSFEVRSGEVVGLLGANGAGKTTTLRIITGLVKASGGHIRLLDVDAPHGLPRVSRQLGAVIEEPGLYPSVTAATMVRIAALQSGRHSTEAEIAALLSVVGLADARKKRVRKFSTGMKTRLGIACALVNNPAFLVLDEPTSGLDPIGRRDLRALLSRLSELGTAVLMASHELSEVELTCDRVLLVDRGRCVLSGSIANVIDPHRGTWVRAADPAACAGALVAAGMRARLEKNWVLAEGVTSRATLTALREANIFPIDVRPATVTLEDVFMAIAGGAR
jgi:ABC-2 type transport system ATP-binding protein